MGMIAVVAASAMWRVKRARAGEPLRLTRTPLYWSSSRMMSASAISLS